MIKTSGYRVSPTEVEEVLYATKLVGEVRGLRRRPSGARPGDRQVIATPPAGGPAWTPEALLAECRKRLPAYMVPAAIEVHAPGRCRATPTARSTARRWSAEFERTP